MVVKSIYLDVCALCRPFDDQSFLRISLETQAVNLIIAAIRNGRYEMLFSPVHKIEIASIEEELERTHLLTMLETLGRPVRVDKKATRRRAEELVNKGFGVADATHVAFAEQSGAEFITTDLKLIKKCIRQKIRIWCGSPIMFSEKEDLK